MADELMRVTINDPVLWGKLVKSWATGKSYFGPGTQAPPIPQSITELKAQCVAAGINIDIPANITGLAVLRYSPEMLAIRLPPRVLLEQSEAKLAALGNAAYPLPGFYEDFFEHPPQNLDQIMDFHAARIGEYTVNSCM